MNNEHCYLIAYDIHNDDDLRDEIRESIKIFRNEKGRKQSVRKVQESIYMCKLTEEIKDELIHMIRLDFYVAGYTAKDQVLIIDLGTDSDDLPVEYIGKFFSGGEHIEYMEEED